MNKYKDYDARLQSNRIQLDILYTLDKILEELKSKYNDEQIVSDKDVKEIKKEIAEVKPEKKSHKRGGDK